LLFPRHRHGKELPKALSHLSPDLLGFEHVSLAPSLSASAETIRTNESSCQAKTYVTSASRDQRLETPSKPTMGIEEVGVGALASRERSEEHTSELQSRFDLVCRLLLEKKK